MNWMQRNTLIKFLFSDEVSLKELIPEDVDSNLYSYHLNQLVKEGLVKKSGHGKYKLTLLGKHTAGLISKDTGKIRKQPKIVVMIYAKDEQGRYLFFKWQRQPYLGQVSLPYGKIHFGESPNQAVRRELTEKTSLSADFSYLKDIYVKLSEEDIILTHMLIHVFKAENLKGSLKDTVAGRPFFASLDEELNFVPGLRELLSAIESDSSDLSEIETTV